MCGGGGGDTKDQNGGECGLVTSARCLLQKLLASKCPSVCKSFPSKRLCLSPDLGNTEWLVGCLWQPYKSLGSGEGNRWRHTDVTALSGAVISQPRL